MKNVSRAAAIAALVSSLSFAAPPPAAAPAPAAAAKPAPVTEFPLSCVPAAKTLVYKAWDLAFNSRSDEARETFKQAVAADPKCVIARAQLSMFTPGPDGKKMFEETLTQTAGLTEIEKLELQISEANRAGDPEKAYALALKQRELAPSVFILNLTVANSAQALNKWEEMGAAAKKAAELNPKSGAAWNMAGYSNLNLHKNDDAVAAFRKYVELAPTEPNAHDSLADALLANNQLDEAAAEYQKAIDASGGKFWMSFDGLATVQAIKGDWDGARASLAKQKDSAIEPQDKIRASRWTAWSWAAQGKLAAALKTVDACEKDSAAAKLDFGVAFAPILRGYVNNANGKYADGLKAFTAAEKVKIDMLSDGQKRDLTAMRLVGTIESQARLNKAADAEKLIAKVEELYKATPGDPGGVDQLAYAKGVVALAKKDAKGAVESLKKCSEQYDLCKLTLAEAQDKAADAAGATETRAALTKANHRDPIYWVVRAQLEAKAKVPGKKVAEETPKKK